MHGGEVRTGTIALPRGIDARWSDAKLQNTLPVFNLEILYAPDRSALQPTQG
jgi:hypothetical protein